MKQRAFFASVPWGANVVYDVSIAGPVMSSDGGATFGNRGSGLPSGLASAIAVDPQNDTTVYVAFPSAAGVYKSTDSGAHWTLANSGLTAPQVFSLAIDPTDGKTLYAGGRASAFFKSTDGAASWTPLNLGLGELTCSDIEVSAGTSSTILAATTHGVVKSTDGGTSWLHGDGIEDAETFAVAIDPTQPATFLAATAVHVYRTADGGATRALSDAGLSSFSTRWIATDLHDDAVLYAAGPAGLARSADHSRSWTIATAITPTRVAVDADASTFTPRRATRSIAASTAEGRGPLSATACRVWRRNSSPPIRRSPARSTRSSTARSTRWSATARG